MKAPPAWAWRRIGRRRDLACSRPSAAVRGEYRDDSAVGLMLTLTRGSGPRSSRSRWSSGAQPGRGLDEGGEQLADPLGVEVGFGLGDGLLAQQVDGERAPLPPQPVQALHRLGRPRPHDELLGHLGDVVPGDGGGRSLAEGDVLGQVEPEVEGLGDVGALEVLLQVAQHVGVAGGRREDVDEPEQLGLERRVRHGPLEHPLGPPRRLDQPGALLSGQLGQLASDRRGGGIERRAHHPGGYGSSRRYRFRIPGRP